MITCVLFTFEGKFIRVKPQCYFGQFCIEDLYCTVNRIMLNIYPCVISKKYKRQDITRVHNIIDVDQKEKGTKYIDPCGTPVFKFDDVELI